MGGNFNQKETDMNYKIKLCSNNGEVDYSNDTLSLIAENDHDDTRFSMTVEFSEWENDAYVFLPACAYNGNRFERISCQYPPMYRPSDCKVNASPIISEVPSLNLDGSGKIEVSAGDMSVPCFGVFLKRVGKAYFIFTEQACKGKDIGFAVENGSVTLQFPVIRSLCYRMCRTDEPSTDCGISVCAGETVSSKILIKDFQCQSIPEFFELFFNNRRSVLSDRHAPNGYTEELWNIMEAHMNTDSFNGEHYCVGASEMWQCGWCGGGMSALPLLKHGNALTRQRSVQTIDFMTSHTSPEGFFYSLIIHGEIKDDGFENEHMKDSALVRKNGDALYFLFKQFDVISPKEAWISAAKKCADAFVRLYRRYGDFGQYVNVETGEMIFGGTTCGAPVISALVRAWRYFGDCKYLEIAKLAGEKYYRDFVARGVTYGGPGDALCAPDSESAYAMVESMVLLYEAEGKEKWLRYAKDSLHLFSSWVMPYSYAFPPESQLGRLRVNTVGSVFANVQNKHSAPGICTASGDALYKLYRYTGIGEYLELLRDIAFFIPQCVSTEKRPLYSWNDPPKRLPSGWINERVSTSDWQGAHRVGGVSCASNWCETSVLLSFSELIWNDEISNVL